MKNLWKERISGKNVLPAVIFIIKNPYPCIAVLIANDRGEILLGKRGKDSIYPGRWCLPCGYIEYDETYLEAAVREVQEEAGITVMPDGIINVVSNHFPNGVHSLVVVLLGHYSGDDVLTPGDDIVDAGWFSIEDMTKLPPLAFFRRYIYYYKV